MAESVEDANNAATGSDATAGANVADGTETASGAEPGTGDGHPKRGRRQELVGTVSSNKMTKTVVVKVNNIVRHKKYKKILRRTSKFMAHNEIEDVSIGDRVRIISTRPLSAHKRWRVVEVVQKVKR